jgi:AraC-like DNA-binding protein
MFSRKKTNFNFPLHYHDEFELNFIENGKGSKRILGDHVGIIGDWELALIGSNLPHGWFDCENTGQEIFEITIQFHKDLFDDKFLKRNQSSFIRTMLDRSVRGILFSQETIQVIRPRLVALTQKTGFESVLELMSILHTLSISPNIQMLANPTFVNEKYDYNSRRIEKAFDFMYNNYDKEIALKDVANIAGMNEVAFSRFIKKRTGRTFVENLSEIRMGYASRLLIDTTLSIAEVAFKCGFENISYFNRTFKKKHNSTPKEFRRNYSGTKVFI